MTDRLGRLLLVALGGRARRLVLVRGYSPAATVHAECAWVLWE